jgi:hypothetical protein
VACAGPGDSERDFAAAGGRLRDLSKCRHGLVLLEYRRGRSYRLFCLLV